MTGGAPSPTTRPGQDGFVLPLVLWIVAGLALAAAVATQWVSAGLDRAAARQAEVRAERAMTNAEAALIFQFATQFLSNRGLEVYGDGGVTATRGGDPFNDLPQSERYLALDGRHYTLGDVDIVIQDTRGLVNLNLANDDEVFRLLGLLGVAVEARGPLIAKLRDYIQPGELKRLNGAKSDDYRAAGREAPNFAPLVTPYEVLKVLDWDQHPSLARERGGIADLTTTSTSVGINFNTATPEVLSLIEGMNPQAVNALIDRRRRQPVVSIFDAQAASGVSVLDDPLRYIFFPADSFRVTFRLKDRPLERVMVFRLTPQQVNGPWRVDYALDLPQSSVHDHAEPEPLPFPLAPTLSVAR